VRVAKRIGDEVGDVKVKLDQLRRTSLATRFASANHVARFPPLKNIPLSTCFVLLSPKSASIANLLTNPSVMFAYSLLDI
jgi:hypothetical protein